jgi:hypothetical protein
VEWCKESQSEERRLGTKVQETLEALLVSEQLVRQEALPELRKRAGEAGVSLWQLLRQDGVLTAKQADNLEMANKGYMPVEAVRITLRMATKAGSGSDTQLHRGLTTPQIAKGAAAVTPVPALRKSQTGVSVMTPSPLAPHAKAPLEPAPSGPSTPSTPVALGPSQPGPRPASSRPAAPPTEPAAPPTELAGEPRPASQSTERRNAPLQSLVGKRLGKYQITSQLGRGASGTVFLAHHTMLNIPVALKFLDPALASYHPELLQRFMHEARSAARINHPNIVRILDCDQIDGLNLIVMEYVDGISLSELININGHVPEDRALVMTRSVAEGLEAALEAGIIHRDIKPANIMVTKSKQVKLADMGLAKRVDAGADLSDTQPNTGMGTPHYFAPEQASDASSVDHRSDIYALGATLFHMLTGRLPYEGRNLQELVRMHQMEPIPMACTLRPDVSEEASHLITRMMAKNPADRFATYADLINAVQACIVAERHYQSKGANSDAWRGQRTSTFKSLFGIFGDKK